MMSVRGDRVAQVITLVTTHHEQASHAHDERWKGRGRGLRVERRYLVLHFRERQPLHSGRINPSSTIESGDVGSPSVYQLWR